jgi:hypothetical protein
LTLRTNILPQSIVIAAKLLEELVNYSRRFSDGIGYRFTSKSIRLTALTGAAATEIGGTTTASTFNYMKKKCHATAEEIEDFADTRMNIIDEISFADYKNVLTKISKNLQQYTPQSTSVYGSIAMVFLGDFCQLEWISKDCIYKHADGYLWGNALNCMVELKGTHRYAGCPFLKVIIPQMREHGLTDEHRDILHTRLINQNGITMPDPATTRFATFDNKTRCQINADVFKSYLQTYHKDCGSQTICRTAIVIKANAEWGNGKPLSFGARKKLFEEVSEADITTDRNTRCDPLLCLYDGCNMMGTTNTDVENGIANGTTCTFKKVVLLQGKSPHPIRMYGYWVYAISVNDVEYMELNFQDSSRFVGRFRVRPKRMLYTVNIPTSKDSREQGAPRTVENKMHLTQFPVVINHATTVHKLQGKTMDRLVIAQWSAHKNWAYVAISRVRTLAGLYLTKPIKDNIDFCPIPEYLEMMAYFRKQFLALPEDVRELKLKLNL